MTAEQLAKVNRRQNLENVVGAIDGAQNLCWSYTLNRDILEPLNKALVKAQAALKAAREDEAAVLA